MRVEWGGGTIAVSHQPPPFSSGHVTNIIAELEAIHNLRSHQNNKDGAGERMWGDHHCAMAH